MKGSSLFSDVFMLFVLIVTMLLISGLLWAVIVTYTLDFDSERNVAIRFFELTLKNDGILLAFLESTQDGVPMKTLITLYGLQRPEDGIVSYNEQPYNVKELSQELLDEIYIQRYIDEGKTPKKYMLRLSDIDTILAESRAEVRTDDYVSTKIFLVADSVDLELYVD